MKIRELLTEAKQQFITDQDKIREWLSTYGIWKAYDITEDGSVDVYSHTNDQIRFDGVNFTGYDDLSKISVKFGEVDGNFILQEHPKLRSLKGSPDIVTGDYYVYKCPNIKTLDGVPKRVGSFALSEAQVKDFTGVPELIDGTMGEMAIYSSKHLVSLKGCPKVVGDFAVPECPNLKSLVGGPEVVSERYNIQGTGVESLDGVAKKIGHLLDITATSITSLKGIHELTEFTAGDHGQINMGYTNIKDGFIDVLKLKGFTEIHESQGLSSKLLKVITIINEQAGKGKKGIIQAQQDLIDADLEDYI